MTQNFRLKPSSQKKIEVFDYNLTCLVKYGVFLTRNLQSSMDLSCTEVNIQILCSHARVVDMVQW